MRWFALIHLLWMIVALFLGIKNLSIGFNRAKTWTFPARKHRFLGLLFITIGVAGNIIAWQTYATMHKIDQNFHLPGFNFIAWLVIGFLILITLSGFLRQVRWHNFRWLQSLHGWFGVLATGLFFAQLFIVIAKYLGWL